MQCYKNSFGSKINATELYLGFFFFFLKTFRQHSVLYALSITLPHPLTKKIKNKRKTKHQKAFLHLLSIFADT